MGGCNIIRKFSSGRPNVLARRFSSTFDPDSWIASERTRRCRLRKQKKYAVNRVIGQRPPANALRFSVAKKDAFLHDFIKVVP
jgi:hypothetical protein